VKGEMDERQWHKFNLDILKGANYALRILRTSPSVKGRSLHIIDVLLREISDAVGRKALTIKDGNVVEYDGAS
jgi:hypothetical protein